MNATPSELCDSARYDLNLVYEKEAALEITHSSLEKFSSRALLELNNFPKEQFKGSSHNRSSSRGWAKKTLAGRQGFEPR